MLNDFASNSFAGNDIYSDRDDATNSRTSSSECCYFKNSSFPSFTQSHEHQRAVDIEAQVRPRQKPGETPHLGALQGQDQTHRGGEESPQGGREGGQNQKQVRISSVIRR